jgi:SAM-dependent methyltransferase
MLTPNTQKQFWNSRYETGETGWDIGFVSTPLKNYFDTLTQKDQRILIPGCGNAYEAQYLLDQGFSNITLIDIAPLVVERLKKKFEGQAGIKIICGDFFSHSESYDLIIEQTFFCALPPVLRPKYVKHMHTLLNPTKGKLAGLLFDKIFNKEGPPFGGTKLEYVDLFKILFTFVTLNRAMDSIAARAGTELFFVAEPK